MRHILTLNAGSSSVRFALFEAGTDYRELVRGHIEEIGAEPHFAVAGDDLPRPDARSVTDHDTALTAILAYLEERFEDAETVAVGHRVVHGGPRLSEPAVLDDEIVAELERFVPLAPLHQPHNLSGVRAARKAFPRALQVGCFDTAFHRAHPWVEDAYALPRELYDDGVRRYGFHGLSYEYVTQELRRIAPETARGRVVICHLGNGASMCAVSDGSAVSTTMGFSPLDGLAMGTRCGQLDPGVVLYLMTEKRMSADAIEDLLYRRSGLKGLSGLSHDMRELEAAGTAEAEQAIAYFVARVRRELGGLAATLGGLDAVVFCGGIGENGRRVRAQVCDGMDWLGLTLDEARNAAGETVISANGSRVAAFVIRTNEELMIARHTAALLR